MATTAISNITHTTTKSPIRPVTNRLIQHYIEQGYSTNPILIEAFKRQTSLIKLGQPYPLLVSLRAELEQDRQA